jgi:hypothetical protein
MREVAEAERLLAKALGSPGGTLSDQPRRRTPNTASSKVTQKASLNITEKKVVQHMRRQREADKRVWGQMLSEVQDMLQESRSENLILRERVAELEEVLQAHEITFND